MDGRPVFRSGQPNRALIAELEAAGNVPPDISRLTGQTQDVLLSPAPLDDEVQGYSPVRPFAPLVAYTGQARALAPKGTDFDEPFDPLSAPIETVLLHSPWPGEQESSIFAAVRRGMQQARQDQKNPSSEAHESTFDPLTAPLHEVTARIGHDSTMPAHDGVSEKTPEDDQPNARYAAHAQSESAIPAAYLFFDEKPASHPSAPDASTSPPQPSDEVSYFQKPKNKPSFARPSIAVLNQVLEGLYKLDVPAPSLDEQPEHVHEAVVELHEPAITARAITPAEPATAIVQPQQKPNNSRPHGNPASPVNDPTAASNLQPVRFHLKPHPRAGSSDTAPPKNLNEDTQTPGAPTPAAENGPRQTAESARQVSKQDILRQLRRLGKSAMILSGAATTAAIIFGTRRKNRRTY
ncbi:MAG TPA: hypothetical protein VLG16_04235 [Candidatus Saccharimonadales bacterium]|nr:hypothetical protein [Candidatus Saccharimonadales bacterium]